MLNVKRELAAKSVSIKALAALLGVSEKTAWSKTNGEYEFSVSEALKVKRELLPEFEIGYLFEDSSEYVSTD